MSISVPLAGSYKLFAQFTEVPTGAVLRNRESRTTGGCPLAWNASAGIVVQGTLHTNALSSAESELNAMCEATQEGLTAKHLGDELEQPHALNLYPDSSAARRVAMLTRIRES